MFRHSVMLARRLHHPAPPSSKWFHCGIPAFAVEAPLNGIKVLDITRILAGPFCTMILGDLGADIIKVERPDVGDETRHWGPPFVSGESCYFLSVNRNKKSIAVDMKHEDGCKIIKQLAVQSDVLVENYVPGKLDEMGLGYETLSRLAPKLIYCSITGYGQTGPYRSRTGYDAIAASIGGQLHITGPEGGEPCKIGVAMTNLATGLYAYGAILAALLHRSKTGRGQQIDCNLLSTQVSLLINLSSNYLNAGQEAKRWGTAHESIVPYQTFKTSDGYVTVGAGSDAQFKALCKSLDLEHLSEDLRYLTNRDRVANRDMLVKELSARFAKHTTSHWLQALEGSGMPYGPVNSIRQVFDDPQVQHSQMVMQMAHPVAGLVKLTGPAVRYGSNFATSPSAPPTLGQHTDQILKDVLHLPDREILRLRACKAIS